MMADTEWGKEAELNYAAALEMKERAERTEDYNRRCIFCAQLVFYQPDYMSRMEGHVYSVPGMKECLRTFICEYCFDKTAASMDGIAPSYWVKLCPQDSRIAWQRQQHRALGDWWNDPTATGQQGRWAKPEEYDVTFPDPTFEAEPDPWND